MNPVEIGVGKSFKGLAAYLLHDTREAGDGWTYAEHQTTAARVGWTQSYNLDDADPEKAWRLMAATAKSAGDLKVAAGFKRGKSAVNTVYHFSITFDPADRTDERLERVAVNGALKTLGLDRHQALAVRHTDTGHAHIHVMVNLIDPETGLSAASKQPDGKPALLSNTKKKLSRWAQEFERENGLKIVEGRQANANKRAQGEKVDARRKPRNVYEAEKAEGQDRRLAWLKRQQDEGKRELATAGRDMAERHHTEWQALKAAYAAEKKEMGRDEDTAVKTAIEEAKAARKKSWASMFQRQRDELRDFERGDKTAIGRIWHAAAVMREKALDGDILGGFVAAFSQENRRAVIERRHEKERRALADIVRQEIGEKVGREKRAARFAREMAREAYLRTCGELKTRQTAERQQQQDHWREYNARRRRQFVELGQVPQEQPRHRGPRRGRGMDLDM
ncbi:relaxase/mobilization nuclease domain-containing protein [Jiella marina]|uniref:relaxase/mobilization nuclease domain-containing protein n=1 Tax=Jiella sp. LLJ827 TaxID=2917712 RepID=UPI0021016B7A|nr:relaxase/mobilization nuclease domain-containing protein [Jiella sp. LLJ827]MCQ0990601.1 relaxase/mobilization nuclease domain-containing protein [Jiella sp. LLJ827]